MGLYVVDVYEVYADSYCVYADSIEEAESIAREAQLNYEIGNFGNIDYWSEGEIVASKVNSTWLGIYDAINKPKDATIDSISYDYEIGEWVARYEDGRYKRVDEVF